MWLTAFQSNLNKPGSWPEYGLSCSVETELKLLGKAFISTTAVFSIYLPFPAISKKVNATECKQREKRKNAALSQWTLTLKYTSAEKYSIFFFSTGLHSWYRKGKKTGKKKNRRQSVSATRTKKTVTFTASHWEGHLTSRPPCTKSTHHRRSA